MAALRARSPPSRRDAAAAIAAARIDDAGRWPDCALRCPLLAAAEGFRPDRSTSTRPSSVATRLRIGAVDADDPRRAAPARPWPAADRPRDPTSATRANYLYMLTGEVPDPARARAHRAVPDPRRSTTASTPRRSRPGSSPRPAPTSASAVVAALGALSGPLHGGAPSRALDTLDAIGTPDRADGWIRDAVAHGERIMGFGHPVYKTDDPRSAMLREIARALGGPLSSSPMQVEAASLDTLAELKPDRRCTPTSSSTRAW